LRLARNIGFGSCWSCDINQASVDAARADGFANTHCMPSPEFLAMILPTLSGTITFWLDAHPCVKPMDITLQTVPLLAELAAIREHANDGPHTILIDDMRVISFEHQTLLHGEIRRLWPTCEFRLWEDDLAPDDILAVSLKP